MPGVVERHQGVPSNSPPPYHPHHCPPDPRSVNLHVSYDEPHEVWIGVLPAEHRGPAPAQQMLVVTHQINLGPATSQPNFPEHTALLAGGSEGRTNYKSFPIGFSQWPYNDNTYDAVETGRARNSSSANRNTALVSGDRQAMIRPSQEERNCVSWFWVLFIALAIYVWFSWREPVYPMLFLIWFLWWWIAK
jgi:hypothetical protein